MTQVDFTTSCPEFQKHSRSLQIKWHNNTVNISFAASQLLEGVPLISNRRDSQISLAPFGKSLSAHYHGCRLFQHTYLITKICFDALPSYHLDPIQSFTKRKQLV